MLFIFLKCYWSTVAFSKLAVHCSCKVWMLFVTMVMSVCFCSSILVSSRLAHLLFDWWRLARSPSPIPRSPLLFGHSFRSPSFVNDCWSPPRWDNLSLRLLLCVILGPRQVSCSSWRSCANLGSRILTVRCSSSLFSLSLLISTGGMDVLRMSSFSLFVLSCRKGSYLKNL